MAPSQFRAIGKMEPSTTKKQIQTLIGKLTALNRFISRYSDHLQTFFTILKGASSKGWGLEYDNAFHSIKDYIASPLSLSQPVDGEELYLYLAASTMTVITTLVRSDGNGKKKPIYFVSKMLKNVETRYTDFVRIALAL